MIRLTLPWPPSVNHTWRRGKGRTYLAKPARLYRLAVKSVIAAARLQGTPLAGPLEVGVLLCPPDLRRRDEDNYAKAPFDALTHAGVWGDDSQVRRKTVAWGPKVAGGRLEITIKPMEAA